MSDSLQNYSLLSDYERFRMGRLPDTSDCDNMSAHFSNQLSTRTEHEDDWDRWPKKTKENSTK